jgi:DNA gyrase/topoisomerase IV subunit B
MNDKHPKEPTKVDKNFTEYYEKWKKFRKEKITKERLDQFIKENPGFIKIVSAEKAVKAQKAFEKKMQEDPIGKLYLDESETLLKKLHEAHKKKEKK